MDLGTDYKLLLVQAVVLTKSKQITEIERRALEINILLLDDTYDVYCKKFNKEKKSHTDSIMEKLHNQDLKRDFYSAQLVAEINKKMEALLDSMIDATGTCVEENTQKKIYSKYARSIYASESYRNYKIRHTFTVVNNLTKQNALFLGRVLGANCFIGMVNASNLTTQEKEYLTGIYGTIELIKGYCKDLGVALIGACRSANVGKIKALLNEKNIQLYEEEMCMNFIMGGLADYYEQYKEFIVDKKRAFITACRFGFLPAVKHFLRNSSRGSFYTAREGHIQVIKLLLENNLLNRDAAIKGAMYSDNTEVLNILLPKILFTIVND